jgi:hypothetical protein
VGFILYDIDTPGVVITPGTETTLGELSVALEDWKPADPEDFGLSLLLEIGVEGVTGAYNFRIFVCSRSHYENADQEHRKRIRTQKHMFIERFDPQIIREKIDQILKECFKGTWDNSLPELRKRLGWEYEYFNQPAPPDLH